MLRKIRKYFDANIRPPGDDPEKISAHSLKLATAALLIEMMRADFQSSEVERTAIISALKSKFRLGTEETEALISLAEEEVTRSSSSYGFTTLINKGFSYEQKVKVIELMWSVAFADGKVDKHEEHIVRRIAGLIYVEHRDFIAAKLRVRDRSQSAK